MRIVLNILILIMAVMLLAGTAWQHRERTSVHERIEQTKQEVDQFRRVIALHAALNNIERSTRGYPLQIDPAWFDDDEVPVNPLLDASHPWLEIAHPDQEHLMHPSARAATDTIHARFWYNPANGIIRARVPRSASDASTLRLYNAVNGTDLASLLPDPSTRRVNDNDDEDDVSGATQDVDDDV